MNASGKFLELLILSSLCALTLAACSGGDGDEDDDVDMSVSMQDMPSDMMTESQDMPGDTGGQVDADMGGEDATPDVDMPVVDMTDVDMGPAQDLEVLGQWANLYGTETITPEEWGFYTLVEYDNDNNVAITRNVDDGTDFALKYNRFVWTDVAADGSFYYCTSDFGKDTLEDAKTDPTEVDASTPDVSGCGGFSWTRLVPNANIEVEGTYISSFGGMESVANDAWDFGYLVAAVISFNNATRVAITQNPDGEPDTFPNTFSRVVWTAPDADGAFYYCTSDFGKATAEDAAMMPTMVDDTDPGVSGCGGFPWTKLSVMQ